MNPDGAEIKDVVDEPDEVWRYFDAALKIPDQLSSATTIEEALGSILSTILSELGWDVGGLWLVAGDGRRLVCASTWPWDGGPMRSFEAVSRSIRPRIGEGMPGSAWGSGRPLVSSVAEGEAHLLRQHAMNECGLQTGIAFPLVSNGRVTGVIEMYSRQSLPVSMRLLDGLANLGRQIGQQIEHAREDTRRREEERVRSFLLEASEVMSAATDAADALRRLAEFSVPDMGDLCLIDIRETDGEITRIAAAHSDPSKAALMKELATEYPPEPGQDHPATEVMATGVSSWSASMSDEFLRATTRDERHFQIVKELGFESYMSVPLRDGDTVLGAITIVSAGSGRRFGLADLELPEELADRAASVLVAARKHEAERHLAHELQRLLLPEGLPSVPGFELCVRYLAAAPQASAGGDFYDVVVLPSGRIGLLIGDVEGHDTVAAATMGQLRSASRALAGQVRSPAELLDALRWSWELLGFERTATALFAWLDPESGEVELASAGHPPPAWRDASGRASLVQLEPSPPLGAHGYSAVESRFVLSTDDVLVMYTDGLVELRGTDLDERLDGLVESLRLASTRSLDDVCESLVARFAPARHELQDDVALLAVKRKPS